MNFDLQGVHGYSPGKSVREYLEKKLKRLDNLGKYVSDIHIRLGKKGDGEYDATADLHFSRANIVHVSTYNWKLFPAIDNLFDKMVARIRKEKGKKLDR